MIELMHRALPGSLPADSLAGDLGGADCAFQLPHPSLGTLNAEHGAALPVRQLDDDRSELRPLDADAAVLYRTIGECDPIPPAMYLQRLACAANPFDFWPLIELGFAEWSGTSDALLCGAPVQGALDLFRDGLGNGCLDLFLGFERSADKVDGSVEPGALITFSEDGVRHCDEVEFRDAVELAEQDSGQAVTVLQGGPVIFDVVSVFHGYLQGHLLWVAPEYRGRGLVGQYFDAALAVAGRHGLSGFMFLSTLHFWERRAPRYGFEARGCIRQPGGPDVIGWFREVC